MSKQKKEMLVKEVNGTPFALVQLEDGNYMSVFGRYALTNERFADEECFRKWLENNQWNVTAVIALITADQVNKENQKKEKEN